MAKGSKNEGSARYFSARTRIKNKSHKLEKHISRLKPEAQEKVKKSCPIGRKREGFNRVQNSPKKKVVRQEVKATNTNENKPI